mgnify:CR=1 FL=1
MPASEAVPTSDPLVVTPGLDCHFLEIGRAAPDTGIGDTRIDAPEMVFQFGHAFDDFSFLADIDRPGRDLAGAKLFQLGDSRRVDLGIAAPDGDIGIRGGEGFGHAEPDPPVAASDKADLSGKVERCVGHRRLLRYDFGDNT